MFIHDRNEIDLFADSVVIELESGGYIAKKLLFQEGLSIMMLTYPSRLSRETEMRILDGFFHF